MEGVFALVILTLLTISVITLIRPLPRLHIPTRKEAGGLLFLSCVLFVIFGVVYGEKKDEAKHQGQTQVSTEPPPPMTSPASWNAHDYQVIENTDISVVNRKRQDMRIVAPAAVTREDRIATLMAAAIQEHRKTWPDFIAISLTLDDVSDFTVARVEYAPDGCGVSGEDCTGEMWTNARSAEGMPSPEQLAIQKAWFTHEEQFKEKKQYDWGEVEEVNEDRLKGFLAKEFDVTPDHIEKQFLAVSVLTIGQQALELPGHLRKTGALTKADEEQACRHDLQCWGDKGLISAGVFCEEDIERLAKYAHKWTDGWLEPKFSRFRWKDREQGHLTYIGDKIQFQNGFGAFQNHTYECDFDPASNTVLGVSAQARR